MKTRGEFKISAFKKFDKVKIKNFTSLFSLENLKQDPRQEGTHLTY